MMVKARFAVANDNGNARVLWSASACEAHEGIIDMFFPTAVIGRRRPSIVPVVMTSPDEGFDGSLDEWTFGIEQESVPDWFDAEEMERAVRDELRRWREASMVCPGEVRKRIGGNQHVVAVLGEVEEVGDSATIERVCGSGRIRYLGGHAHVENVHDSAVIDNVCGSAAIGCVSDSATIKYMYGMAAAMHVSGSAVIKSIYGSATVFFAHGTATVEHMHGSARIGCLYGSAEVEHLYGAATIEAAYGTASIGAVHGTATIESLQDSATIGRIEGPAQAVYYTTPDLAVARHPDAVIIDRSGPQVHAYVGVQG